MRVVCTRIPIPFDGASLEASPWVTLDHDYAVLGVLAESVRSVQLHLLLDDGSLGWFDSKCFMTVEGGVPGSWSTRIGEGGTFELGPAEWLAEGFWERYYEGDPEAQESVRREVIRIGDGGP